ncbi:peptidoglycan recognition protein family protein [Companilactobacillus metriopterae]|uniref:peptidoglycan recognition protein family protein n=1 Tax=Companilactobacillus metriopterae TaxID=1909267 RepID=UPI00100B128D|nr:N-acetylmuramoyl-L-alanine amidase [Companilactobacillus metriopterae]
MFLHKKFIARIATAAALATFGLVTYNQVSPNAAVEVKADSWINQYIVDNNIKPASITYEQGTFSNFFAYRHGVGKPEGVVIHETATPGATARNEVTLFNRDWGKLNTYVHAFVDDKEILNIHSTDYGVWGAGPTANSRYIQVELCEVKTADAFARSVSNQAYYTAAKLLQYGLPFEPGTTVVSHKQTGDMFHETNHVDPDTYFDTWGYDMEQFNALVSTYYNNMKNGNAVDSGTGSTTAGGGSTTSPNGNAKGDGVVNVSNSTNSSVPIVQFNAAGKPVNSNRALANNTPWYTDQTKTYGGHTYYRVSTKEYVEDTYATFTAN